MIPGDSTMLMTATNPIRPTLELIPRLQGVSTTHGSSIGAQLLFTAKPQTMAHEVSTPNTWRGRHWVNSAMREQRPATSWGGAWAVYPSGSKKRSEWLSPWGSHPSILFPSDCPNEGPKSARGASAPAKH